MSQVVSCRGGIISMDHCYKNTDQYNLSLLSYPATPDCYVLWCIGDRNRVCRAHGGMSPQYRKTIGRVFFPKHIHVVVFPIT